jgi:hypothetical protein
LNDSEVPETRSLTGAQWLHWFFRSHRFACLCGKTGSHEIKVSTTLNMQSPESQLLWVRTPGILVDTEDRVLALIDVHDDLGMFKLIMVWTCPECVAEWKDNVPSEGIKIRAIPRIVPE